MDNLLKEHNIRKTKLRIAILNLLKRSDPMTAEDIHKKLAGQGAKLSSVYRNLSLLTDKHLLTRIAGLNNFFYYQLNTEQHKHHLTCSVCRKSIAIEDCPVQKIENDIEAKTGYIITNHIFEFIGLCPKCQNKTGN